MRLLMASDLHGSLESLRFLLTRAHALRPDLLVLLGDLVYHGPRNPLPQGYNTPTVLKEMADLNALPCPITAVRGNCDAEVDLTLLPFPVAENAWIDAERPPLPGMPQGAVILRGHTHVPRGESLDGLHFWNPGSLSLPKGGSPRSYGLYEEGVFRVLDMQDREILRHQPGGA